MEHIRLRILFIIASISILSSCKETVSSGTPGDIIGTMHLFDTNNVNMTDNSGLKVSLDGTNYSAISDASGKWHLTDIPAGTYTLVFSKDGYGTIKQQDFEFTGNGTLLYNLLPNYYNVMYPAPNLYPDLVLRPFEDFLQITLKDTTIQRRDTLTDSNVYYHVGIYDTVIVKSGTAIFSSHTQYIYHGQTPINFIFLSKSQNIDPSVPSSYQYSKTFQNDSDTSGIANVAIDRSVLLGSGFSSGDNIYCIVYSCTYPSLHNWTDPVSGKYVYSGFSPHHSEVRSFSLP